jgi:hypothetical protein
MILVAWDREVARLSRVTISARGVKRLNHRGLRGTQRKTEEFGLLMP